MVPNSAKELPEPRSNKKRKPCRLRKFPEETPNNVSSAAPAENSNEKSVWDDNFPFGDLIDKNFITEKDRKEIGEWGFEKYFHVLKAGPIQLVSIGRCMERKVYDLEKKNKAYIEQVTDLEKKNKAYIEQVSELENKLSESEKNVGKLKKDLEELSLEKRRVMAREEELMEENSKITIKLQMKEHIISNSKTRIEELKGEIRNLKTSVEELKGEIPLHQKAGFDKAVKQILASVSDLKP